MVEDGDVWFSTSDNPKRKYPHTWEISTTEQGHLVGVNSARANTLVAEALDRRAIPELSAYKNYRREVKLESGSRLDFMLSENPDDSRPCYLEVKSMTLMREPGLGEFPDAVTVRGQKHLRELAELARSGVRAILLFCVQHSGVTRVAVAQDIDPVYAQALHDARLAGVEVLAYSALVLPNEIRLSEALPWGFGGEAVE